MYLLRITPHGKDAICAEAERQWSCLVEAVRELSLKAFRGEINPDASGLPDLKAELQKELDRKGVTLVFAHVRADLKPDLDRHHLTEVIGPTRIFDHLHPAIDAYHKLGAQV